MCFYVGVTDTEWYRFLSTHKTEDVNFWQPGGARQFGAVEKGAPFPFRLKVPTTRTCSIRGDHAFRVRDAVSRRGSCRQTGETKSDRSNLGIVE